MIRLFVTDIDGCLATPYEPFRLDILAKIRERAKLGGLPKSHAVWPAVSICSGRAYPYVEAMSQLLDLESPLLYESGAGLFDPVRKCCLWHPDFDRETFEGMDDVKRFVSGLEDGSNLTVDLAKRSQVAVVAPKRTFLDAVYPEVCDYVRLNHPSFRTFMTPFSIDVLAPHLTKRTGMAWLADVCGVRLDEMAFVGDTEGDIGALELVGRSYAPANADTSVKEIVDQTTTGSDADGVLEAYWNVIEFNERANRSAS